MRGMKRTIHLSGIGCKLRKEGKGKRGDKDRCECGNEGETAAAAAAAVAVSVSVWQWQRPAKRITMATTATTTISTLSDSLLTDNHREQKSRAQAVFSCAATLCTPVRPPRPPSAALKAVGCKSEGVSALSLLCTDHRLLLLIDCSIGLEAKKKKKKKNC